MVLKNRMYFNIEKVPAVIQACVVLYNFILYHEGVGEEKVFIDDQPTRSGRGARLDSVAEAAATTARDRESVYLADNFILEEWGEEGSALDLARQAVESRYRGAPGVEDGADEPVIL